WSGREFEKASCFGRLVRLGSALQSNRWIELRDASRFSRRFAAAFEASVSEKAERLKSLVDKEIGLH
ncbi:hypothetical protein NI454_15340, partial [Brevundimonas diminuta]|uniref:hypothetical protein n=1 Tax=Brevundimonas diminuta TaxID=293 RepID=UPI00209747D3